MCNHWFGKKWYQIVVHGGQPIGRGERCMKRKVKNWYKTCENCEWDKFLYSEVIAQW